MIAGVFALIGGEIGFGFPKFGDRVVHGEGDFGVRRQDAAFAGGRVRESGSKLPHSIDWAGCQFDAFTYFHVCLDIP